MSADLTVLAVDGLTKRFGALPVLQNVSLAFARGRVTAILGPNGAGKTTLIKTILGLTRQSAGTIMFDGQPLSPHGKAGTGGRSLSTVDRLRGNIGYMPQIA